MTHTVQTNDNKLLEFDIRIPKREELQQAIEMANADDWNMPVEIPTDIYDLQTEGFRVAIDKQGNVLCKNIFSLKALVCLICLSAWVINKCLLYLWNVLLILNSIKIPKYKSHVFIMTCLSYELLIYYHVGHCCMLSLDDTNAFVTTFITKPELRGKGIGRKVWDACMDAVKGKNVIVNAAPNREEMYNKLGFTVSKNRMEIQDYAFPLKKVEPVEKVEEVAEVFNYQPSMFDKVYAYDQLIQPIERRDFVRNHIAQSDIVKVALNDGKVVGYVCVRKNYKGFMIMPLYADNIKIARQLVHSVANSIDDDTPIKIGIPSGNEGAEEIFTDFGWFARSYNPYYVNLRMHKKVDFADSIKEKKVYSAMNYSYVLI